MKDRGQVTAFYIETLLMILVFVGVILVLSQVFALSRRRSTEAKDLTTAVCLSQNLAEAFHEADEPEELFDLLDTEGRHQTDGSFLLKEHGFTAFYDSDMQPDPSGQFQLAMDWGSPEDGLLSATINVISGEKVLYSLPVTSAGKEGF